MPIPKKVPACYGHLYDISTEQCQQCLINHGCEKAMESPAFSAPKAEEVADLPKGKKPLILAICRKYGIDPVYKSRDGNVYEVTEENMEDYDNLDFLLTNKQALKILYSTELGHANS